MFVSHGGKKKKESKTFWTVTLSGGIRYIRPIYICNAHKQSHHSCSFAFSIDISLHFTRLNKGRREDLSGDCKSLSAALLTFPVIFQFKDRTEFEFFPSYVTHFNDQLVIHFFPSTKSSDIMLFDPATLQWILTTSSFHSVDITQMRWLVLLFFSLSFFFCLSRCSRPPSESSAASILIFPSETAACLCAFVCQGSGLRASGRRWALQLASSSDLSASSFSSLTSPWTVIWQTLWFLFQK